VAVREWFGTVAPPLPTAYTTRWPFAHEKLCIKAIASLTSNLQ
jgi:hypothetical protein